MSEDTPISAAPTGGDVAPEPTPAEIRAELRKILSSRTFVQSERLCRFLRYAVERSLVGLADQTKEYTLGREVFDRDAAFDPRVDSIVRVEAARLRRKLHEYYQVFGENDPVLISFPKGGYLPAFGYRSPAASKSTSSELNSRTVAVLPFENLSPNPEQEYFCDGITEEILNLLAGVEGLRVVARTSSFHFKGRNVDVREIGHQLGAGTVVEGSVRTTENQVRIMAKAIDATTGVLRWSGTFGRQLTGVFAVEVEIASAIADSLRVSLVPAAPETRLTPNAEAYMAYLKGHNIWSQVSQEGPQAAMREFVRAISLFPGHAPSYVGMANVHAQLVLWCVVPPAEGVAQVRHWANEALRLDAGVSGAYAILGVVAAFCDWRWEEGGRLLRRAAEMQPSNMTAQTYLALYQACRQDFAGMAQTLEASLQRDPLSPTTFRNQAWFHYYQRQYDSAAESLNTALALEPNFFEAQFLLCMVNLRRGRYRETIDTLLRMPAGPFASVTLGLLSEAYALAGDVAAARRTLDEIDALSRTEYVSFVRRLGAHLVLGDLDRMFEEMERAYAEGAPWLSSVGIDPCYDPVRSDPRFADLLRRVNPDWRK